MKELKIKVRPHVLKYLQFHLGEEYSLSRADNIGLMLFELLRRQLNDKRRAASVEAYAGEFRVNLKQYPLHKYGLRNITIDTTYTFNNFIHNLVMEESHGFVDQATDDGHRQKDALLAFMAKYNFDDTDIAYDTLKKSYQRHLKENPKTRQQRPRLSCRGELKDLTKQLEKIIVPMVLAGEVLLRSAA